METKVSANHQGLPEALKPEHVGDLLTRIADSDGSQLRWPADELSQRVLGAMFAQGDAERDAFLRGAGDSDWWSNGEDAPC